MKSPELTGEWELKLRKIEKGEYEADKFKEELMKMVWELTHKVMSGQSKVIFVEEKPNNQTKTTKTKKKSIVWEEFNCPKCKNHRLIKGKTAIGCKNFKQCSFKIPFEIFGKKLTEKQLSDLATKGKTSKLKGFKTHPNELTEGVLQLNETFEIELK